MSIKETIIALNEMRAEGVLKQYAIGGAVGAAFYLEPAETEDVDVFIGFEEEPKQLLLSLEPIYQYARTRNWPIEGEYIRIGDWPVQFLSPDSMLVEEAIAKGVEKDIDGVKTVVFSAEHLMAIALKLGRTKDKLRLLQFLEASSSSARAFRFDEVTLDAILNRHGLMDAWMKFKSQMSP